MQARYYDPTIGRFLAPDPVQFSVDEPRFFNRYGYAFNDPVNLIDPDGELPMFAVSCAANPICRGAVVGFATEAFTQVVSGEFDGSDLVVATLAGAATGGLSTRSKMAQVVGDRMIATAEAGIATSLNGGSGKEIMVNSATAFAVSSIMTIPSAGLESIENRIGDGVSGTAARTITTVGSAFAAGELNSYASGKVMDALNEEPTGNHFHENRDPFRHLKGGCGLGYDC